jgi:hypothetical protein
VIERIDPKASWLFNKRHSQRRIGLDVEGPVKQGPYSSDQDAVDLGGLELPADARRVL